MTGQVDIATLAIAIDSTQARVAALELDKLTASSKRAEEQKRNLTKASDSMNAGYARMVGIVSTVTMAVGAVTAAFAYWVGKAIESTAAMKDLAIQAGTTAERLSKFELPAKLAGSSIGAVSHAMYMTTKALVEARDPLSQAAAAFRAVGVNSKALRDMKPDEIFLLLAKRLDQFSEGTAKNAVMIDIFKRSGYEMSKVLKEVASAQTLASSVSNEGAESADKLADTWTEVVFALNQAKRQLGEDYAPSLQRIANAAKEAAKESGLFATAITIVGGALAELLGMNDTEFEKMTSRMKGLQKETSKLKDLIPGARQRDLLNGVAEAVTPIEMRFIALNKELAQSKRFFEELKTATAGGYEDAVSRRMNQGKPNKPTPSTDLNYGGDESRLAADALKERIRLQELYNGVVNKAAGLDSDYTAKLIDLKKALDLGIIGETEYVAAVERHIAAQPLYTNAAKAMQEANEEATKALIEQQKVIEEGDQVVRAFAAASAQATSDMQFEAEMIGRTGYEIAKLTEYRRIDLEARQAILALPPIPEDATSEQSARYARQVDAIRKAADAQKAAVPAVLGLNRVLKEQVDQFAKLNSKAQEFSQAAAKAFGPVGAAIGDLVTSLSAYIAKQDILNKAIAENGQMYDDGAISYEEYYKKQSELAKESAQATMGMYADMASAAKGFFKEGSTGYKVMETAEKAFRAVEMALALESYITQLTQILGIQAAQEGANDSMLSSLISYVAQAIGLKTAEGEAAAVTAVANQGSGDPYSAFVRIAAMVAIMAALGFSVGGGGSGGSGGGAAMREERQRTQGTGSVLGDSGAQSNSLANALELIRANSDLDLMYTSAMLDSLRNIESGISGLAVFVARMSSLSETSSLPSSSRNWMGAGNAFSLADAGIIINAQNLGAARNNVSATGYRDIERQHTGAFGMSSYSAINRDLVPLEVQFSRQLSLVVDGMVRSLGQAVEILTGGARTASEVEGILDSLNIDMTSISLQDLQGDDIQGALQAVFSTIGDNIVGQLLTSIPEIQAVAAFQQVGEGAFETIIRVANGIERADAMLGRFGITMIDWHNITNTQGDVTAELIRQSVVAQESVGGAVNGIGQIIDGLDASAEDMVAIYQRLLDARTILASFDPQAAGGISQAMIEGAGGLEAFSAALSLISSDFLGDSQRLSQANSILASGWARLAEPMAALGLQIPTSRQGFINLLNSIDVTTESGARFYGQVVALAPALDDAGEAIEGIRQSIGDLNDAREALGIIGPGESSRRALASVTQAFMNSVEWDAGMTPEQMQTALRTISDEDFARYTPQQQQWILDILNGIKEVNDSVQSVVESQQVLADAIINQANAQLDAFLRAADAFEGAGRSPMERFTFRSTALRGSIEDIQAQMALTSQGTLNWQVLKANLDALMAQLALTGTHIARLTVLQAQYGEETGAQLFELEQWYTEMQATLSGNEPALAALQALFGQRWQEILDSANGAAGALGELRKAIAEFHNGLLLSNLSTLTPEQRYMETLAEYNRIQALAAAGNQDALRDYPEVARRLLEAAQGMFASSVDYQEIFNRVFRESGLLGEVSGAPPAADSLQLMVDPTQKTAESTRESADSLKSVEQLVTDLIERVREESAADRDTLRGAIADLAAVVAGSRETSGL